jgi:hypothetical protein
VRVRDGDEVDATASLQFVDDRRREEADAVPQDVAGVGLNEQRALGMAKSGAMPTPRRSPSCSIRGSCPTPSSCGVVQA